MMIDFKSMDLLNKNTNPKIELIDIRNSDNGKLIEFWFKLNKTVSHLKIKIKAIGQKDEIISDPEIKYAKDMWYLLAGYENQTVSKWQFIFSGIEISEYKNFRRVVNYQLNI